MTKRSFLLTLGLTHAALLALLVFTPPSAYAESALKTMTTGAATSVAEAPSIDPADLHAQRQKGSAPVVIDVRSAREFAAGHIPGAVNIPYAEVADRIGEVDASKGVALYCMVGPRARKGEKALIEAGVESVFHIEGGMAAWKAAGLPVEKNP